MSWISDGSRDDVRDECTAQLRNGSFCGRPSIPTAPIPICITHASKVYRFVRDSFTDTDRNPTAMLEFIQIFTAPKPQAAKGSSVVYYVRVGSMIKIGTTTRFAGRMNSYPPGSVLLATEPGDKVTESIRLRQFRASLVDRKEWFSPTPPLIAHINSLRDVPLTAADLTA